MIFNVPKAKGVLSKKYPSQPAIELKGKVVHVGVIKTEKEYQKTMHTLLDKYPQAKEEDFVYSFIFGPHPYIL